MKKIIVLLLSLLMFFSLISCTVAKDPTSEYPSMKKFSIESRYSGDNNSNFFHFIFDWKIDGNFEATYTDEYDLYYSMDEVGPYELCEPMSDFNQVPTEFTLTPGGFAELVINVDDKYEGLPAGYYRFVFKFNVSKDGGEPEIYQASVDFDMSM